MSALVMVLERQAQAKWDMAARALATMAHRGPDGEGFVGISHTGSPAAYGDARTRLILGARRFSVLDLSSGGHQPMRCPITNNLIIFSGEIYNFLELKNELANLGHTFVTEGDTEVILAAYAQWGEEAFTRMNGIWAIILYEAESGDVVACRDRLGVKPLFYAQQGERQVMASEIRALLGAAELPASIHAPMAFDFLAGLEINHTDETVFEGVTSVPAGGLWRLNKQGDVARRRYHEWAEPTHYAASPQRLRELLTDSVNLRLRSDAPTVSLLSGGLDSGLITWIASEKAAHAQRTHFAGAFSYGYADDRYAAHDEIAQAMKLVKALPNPMEHTVIRMSPYPTLDELLAMAGAQEQPVSTPSVMASWRLYQHIHRAGIKVVLSGEGSDELFAGRTSRYMPLLLRDRLKKWQLGEVFTLLRSPYLRWRDLFRATAWLLPDRFLLPLLKRYRPAIGMMAPSFWRAQSHRFMPIVNHQRLPLDERLRQDVLNLAMPQKLRYSDCNSMGASVEVRMPFMDYRLVEYALNLPTEEKINAHGGKQILRKAFDGVLPISMQAKPKAHSFGSAEKNLVLEVDFAPLIERAPPVAWEYINRKALVRALSKRRIHPMTWLPISFLLWLTSWVEADAAVANHPINDYTETMQRTLGEPS